MKHPPTSMRLLTLTLAAGLAGCAGVPVADDLRVAGDATERHFQARPVWLDTEAARHEAQAEVDRRLAGPLGADDAVRIALAYSPAMQAVLSDGVAASAAATQAARLPNPVFAFERLVRRHHGETELEIGRLLSVSVLDLLLWPARAQAARAQQQQARLQLASEVARVAVEARQAWVRAVAAEQALRYFGQVKEAADTAAELARRMQAVGNFSKLQRAREQAFYADAVAQLARAQQQARASREALVRVLGLDDAQARALQLPERLPDLPAQPLDEAGVAAGWTQRLDLQLAQAELDRSARVAGLAPVTSVAQGLHLGIARHSESGEPPQKGFELEVPVPLFDLGDARRTEARARHLAAHQRMTALSVQARSELREQHAAYRTAWQLARHYRDEIVPLRKAISDENLLRYNGMFIGVFELLADARSQIGSVVQAIDAQRDFWLADAAFRAAQIGRPVNGSALGAPVAETGSPAGGGH